MYNEREKYTQSLGFLSEIQLTASKDLTILLLVNKEI